MDVKLDSLIEKIKKEGIDEAQSKADAIVKESKDKAASIVDQAKKEAQQIIADGKRQVEQFKANAEADLKQAARNTELLLKQQINKLFDNVFKKEVAETLNADFLKKLITKISESWSSNTEAEISVTEDDKKKLEATLFAGLKGELKNTVTLKASSDVISGFRIGLKGEQVYYDFSDDAIADVLKSLINPNLKEILDK